MRVGKIAKIFGGERQNFEVCVHFKLCAKDELESCEGQKVHGDKLRELFLRGLERGSVEYFA